MRTFFEGFVRANCLRAVFPLLCAGFLPLCAGKDLSEAVDINENALSAVVNRVQKASQHKKEGQFSKDLRVQLTHGRFLAQNKDAFTQSRRPARVSQCSRTWQGRSDALQRQSQEIKQLLQEGQHRIQLLEFIIGLKNTMDSVFLLTKNPLLADKTRHHQIVLQMLQKNVSEETLGVAHGFYMARKLKCSFDEACAISALLPFRELLEIFGPVSAELMEGVPFVQPSLII